MWKQTGYRNICKYSYINICKYIDIKNVTVSCENIWKNATKNVTVIQRRKIEGWKNLILFNGSMNI